MFEIEAQIIRAAMLNAGVKDARHYLNGIYITSTEQGGADVVGTDGHAMYVSHIQDSHGGGEPARTLAWDAVCGILSDVPPNGVILPRFQVPPKAALVQFTPPPIADGAWTVRFIAAITAGGGTLSIVEVSPIMATYPGYGAVTEQLPARGLGGGLFQLDASLFARAEKSFPSKYNSIRMEFHGADRACIATSAAHPGCWMALMPQKLSKEDMKPAKAA